MNIDLGSFAFGSIVKSGGGTCSWGTAFGQSSPTYKYTYPGFESIVIGMMYCSAPKSFFSMPLGKGRHIYKCDEDDTIQLTSIFLNVFVNEKKIDYPFLMAIVKEESTSHFGRRSLKYSDKISYDDGNKQYSNGDFVSAVCDAFGMVDDACWFVYAIDIKNQDELHMKVVVVDAENHCEYVDSAHRKSHWLELIPASDYISNGGEEVSRNGCFTDELPLQQIFYGAPGTGKSYKVKEVTETLPKSDVFRTTFHPDSDYSTFVGCYKPKMVKAPIRDSSGHEITSACEDEKKRIAYEYEPQAFLKAYVRAYETNEPVFLVIEEINRGNCAQIFGDMFQLLDRNEAGESDYAIKPETAIQEFLNEKLKNCDVEDETINLGEEMRLPANLHIWATMNTSDQSLFPIDSAFKRRWEWKYVPISDIGKKWRICVNGSEYDWWSFVQKINDKIWDATHSEDKKLGYFFCKADRKANEDDEENCVISADRFVGKVLFYIYNDVFKDYGFDDAIFKDKEDGNKDLLFQCYFKANGKPEEKKIEVFLNNLDVKLSVDNENEDENENENLDETEETAEGTVAPVSTFKVILDGETIEESEQFDTYLAALKKMGMDKVEEIAAEKEYNRYDCPFVGKERFAAVEDKPGFSYVEADGYQVIKGINKRGMSNFLKLCAERLGHNITIE